MIIGIANFSLTLSHTDADGVTRTGLQGLAVYLIPNFEGLTISRFLEILLDAMSQLFFSLSVSMGIAGTIIGAVFFLMVIFAALTSCVSIMETLVASCMEIFHTTRKKTSLVIGLISAIAAIVICLGYNVFYFELTLPNGGTAQLLDLMDYISNSFLMPFICFLSCVFVGWVIGPKVIEDEMESSGHKFTRKKLYRFMIRYIAPIMMAILFFQSTGLFF